MGGVQRRTRSLAHLAGAERHATPATAVDEGGASLRGEGQGAGRKASATGWWMCGGRLARVRKKRAEWKEDVLAQGVVRRQQHGLCNGGSMLTRVRSSVFVGKSVVGYARVRIRVRICGPGRR